MDSPYKGSVIWIFNVLSLLFTETKMSSFWWKFHHWLHRKLSFWQLSVQPVMKISSKWRHFRFSVSPNKLLSKQTICRWFETPLGSCDVTSVFLQTSARHRLWHIMDKWENVYPIILILHYRRGNSTVLSLVPCIEKLINYYLYWTCNDTVHWRTLWGQNGSFFHKKAIINVQNAGGIWST